MTECTDPMSRKVTVPTFAEALRWWFRLGWISFGGPAGQIATMHEELVVRRRWISEGRFLHALNYCMVLPGPEAQQLATYVGWLMHGSRGGIAAGVLFVLPSLFILAGLSWAYVRFGHTPQVAAVLWGIKPVVVAIVIAAAHRIGRRALRHPALWALACAAFVSVGLLHWPFPAVILAAAVIGAWLGRYWPAVFQAETSPAAHTLGKAGDGPTPALADDDPPPAHAAYRTGRLLRTVSVFVAVWALALVGAHLTLDPGASGAGQAASTALDLGWFHTQAALLTFGGAYAVLPYVHQMAVDHYQWLTAAQMMDGLALGETTPGPLIMVVAFVGWLAGWSRLLPGLDLAPLAGFLGASIATFFTFLPSFLFILAGGPWVEGSRQAFRLKAPLTGITAAVVGVIGSLGLFFGTQVIMPGAGAVDWPALALTAAALLALTRGGRGVVETIAAGALIGLLRWWV